MNTIEIILSLAITVVVVLQLLILMRKQGSNQDAQLLALQTQLQQAQNQQQQAQERSERSLREQVQSTAQATRQELGANFTQFQQTVSAQLTSVATLQNNQIDAFSQQLVKLNESNAQQLEQMRQALTLQGQSARGERK